MKNDRRVVHHHQSARIHERYYRATFNPLHLLKTVLFIILTGGSPTASHYKRMK